MEGNSLSQRKAQLDKAEREHLEDVVEDLRERVENNVRFQLEQKGLDVEPEDRDAIDEGPQQLVEAIDMEGVDGHTWNEAFEKYVAGVGYTIVNRLAGLRCMEVRDFIEEEVTVFKPNGLTPAAETLVNEEFLMEDEAILAAYHNTCEDLADEIEILFDQSSSYSLIDPDDDTFEELCGMLDEVPDEVWRADDVLGWVYEYYNRPIVEELDAKNTLEPDDIGPANQFYTPHWVVRMLADNSLGKLYLEATGKEDTVPEPSALTPEERKERLVTPKDAPDVAELCTYLIPDDEEQDAPSFDHPRELRVIDPACGSGHFLLYAFDILERIWWAETDLDHGEIPAKILEHNLYGVDIDLRSCQLSAFNLYLKARTRAEQEANEAFEMPNVGIVCADARVAEVEEAADVLNQITDEGTDVQETLEEIIEEFQTTEALGSLLDVQSTLSEEFETDQSDIMANWESDAPLTLNAFLKALRESVEEQTSDSFGEQNLRSFLNLLVVLTQDYDVTLMNPPYGSGGRMPDNVQDYVDDHYDYTTEYYINFFEACDRLTKTNGRIGMLVPRSFMFLKSFQDFREDFIGGRGAFDFLAEYGIDILDNATVRTAGTVVRSGITSGTTGTFLRLEDIEKENKEETFLQYSFGSADNKEIPRVYNKDVSEFALIPGKPLSYWVPKKLRSLYDSNSVLDEQNAGLPEREGISDIKQGIATADDGRFLREFWETFDQDSWAPFAKGGVDSWLLPRVKKTLLWGTDGQEVKRFPNSYPRNTGYYFSEGITFNRVKTSGRRFGYLQEGSIFADKGPTIFSEANIWLLLSYSNSRLFTYLMLAQTTERMWEVGQVSKVPWREELEGIDTLKELSREAISHVVSKRKYDFVSPHYDGPVLLDVVNIEDPLPQYNHPHREIKQNVSLDEPTETIKSSESLNKMGIAAAKHLERIEANLQSCANTIDEAVFDCFDITKEQREIVLQEISLRTNEDPRKQEEYNPENISKPRDDFPEMVKDLLLHLAIRAVYEDDDGIVPLSDVDGETALLARIEDEFDRLFGEHADARLAEVDQVLGSKSAGEEAYPNLREWLLNDLFDYHVSKFDRTPILWRLTSERLVSDPNGEGFACLVDYHQLDSNVFDRLQNRYLEPRKALLRERRSAANRRRGDDSLSASEKAEAAEEYDRCESGLEQIELFEERMAELAQPSSRDWTQEQQESAADAAELVREFRDETTSRLATVDELAQRDDTDIESLFASSFGEKVDENREEWVEALNDLEDAFEAYSKGSSEAVEAHLYDLFEYYDSVKGTQHFASNGILYMTYYFDKIEEPEQMKFDGDGDSQRQRLIADLASGLDEYVDLAREIEDRCEEIASEISSDWEDRALAEIITKGYQPNHKHGVVINILPMVNAKIVPETVDDKVI